MGNTLIRGVVDVYEQDIIVDGNQKWVPPTGLMMHTATYEGTYAADDLADMIDAGMSPTRKRLRIIVCLEDIDE